MVTCAYHLRNTQGKEDCELKTSLAYVARLCFEEKDRFSKEIDGMRWLSR